MLIRSKDAATPKSSEITSETTYLTRRRWLASMGYLGMGALLAGVGRPGLAAPGRAAGSGWQSDLLTAKLKSAKPWESDVTADTTPFEVATTYNNFYEFGTGKRDPSENSGDFKVEPWRVKIEGAVKKPGNYTLEDILKPQTLEDRLYRFRCVEAWSMVIPWVGFPLRDLIKQVEPESKAKYVRFETLVDAERFPAQRFGRSTIDWPYVEGLRMDEAMHPLTLLVMGAYGKSLLPQSGAPLRLIVPWKYGFKSIKSITRIQFVEKQPVSTWERMASQEYGFYANVNPKVSHPRWSQARERRLPNSLFNPNWIETQPFNGYADAVADLYSGLDLKKNY